MGNHVISYERLVVDDSFISGLPRCAESQTTPEAAPLARKSGSRKKNLISICRWGNMFYPLKENTLALSNHLF